MNSLQRECFLAAAQTLNVTEAAEKLYFTQQAVSKHISNLEKELGTQLFDRKQKNLSLTRAGEYYVWLFSKTEKKIASVGEDVKNQYEHMARNFSVGYSVWIDPFGEINRGVKQFRRQNPSIAFRGRQYRNSELISELTAGNLDVAFLSEDQIILNNEFEGCPIAREDIALFVPVRVCGGGWSGKPDPKCWGVPFLQTTAWEWSYLESRQIINTEMENLGINPPNVDFLPNIQSIITALQIGRCVTVGDSIFGYFRKVPGMRSQSLGLESRLYCFWHKLNENPIIPRFVEFMGSFYMR